jgi:hypothetical protein
LIQTPHRFRSKRPLWKYSGFGIEMHSSADYRKVQGQLEKTKKKVSVPGLNRDCNHDLKNLFKSAATISRTWCRVHSRYNAAVGFRTPAEHNRQFHLSC